MNVMGSKLRYLYFYSINDDELETICNGLSNGEFDNLEYFGVFGNEYYVLSNDFQPNSNGVQSSESSRKITSIEPLSMLSQTTKKAIKYLLINNNDIEGDLLSLSDFENVYLLRAEYNNLKTLKGLEKMAKLGYLYACNNLLGTECLEDGTDVEKDCLSSLSDKLNLYYVNLRYNINLKWVDYFLNDSAIRFLYLAECNSSMSVNNIASIIKSCGNNYDLPCKFLNGPKYVWSDYFVRSNPTETKPILTAELLKADLINNSYIENLNLSACYTGNPSTEITDEVLNEILKTMPQLKYLRLDSTNISRLDFCNIKNGSGNQKEDLENLNLYSYCPNLVELDIRYTYVTDVSPLNNVVKKTNLNPDGRNMGTLRFSDSNEMIDGKAVLINLDKIQNIINNLTYEHGETVTGSVGLVIVSYDTLKLLEKCTDLTTINSSQWGSKIIKADGIIDLRKLEKLKSICYNGWVVNCVLPKSVKTVTGDQSLPPVLSENSEIESVYNISSQLADYITGDTWRNFFSSCQNCKSINSLIIKRGGSGFAGDFLLSEEGIPLYDGKNLGKLSILGYVDGDDEFGGLVSLNGFRGLSKLKKLEINMLYHIKDFSDISQMTSLEELTLNDCRFKDSNLLSMLSKLKILRLTNMNDSLLNINGLETLTGLISLTVSNCSISSCIPLANLSNLTYLDLRNNAIGITSSLNGENRNNLDILYNLHNTKNGSLVNLYLSGNSGLSLEIINSHPISSLSWSNKIW